MDYALHLVSKKVLIFPEGTCTNRSCLITFKPGGFYPGVPVQPVTIRYPNSLDTVTWTWEGPGAVQCGFYPGVSVQPVTIRYPNSLDTVTWTWEGPGAVQCGFYPGVSVQPVTIRYPNSLDTVTWTWEGPGAVQCGFYPGVSVQPVTIRYPNSLDTVTWTWEGPGALKLLWLTLTQVHSACEIEFLPVYHPSEEEKRDPKLYARNVRDVMAKALGVPVLDYTYDDCRLIARAKQLGIPAAAACREVQQLRQALGPNDNRWAATRQATPPSHSSYCHISYTVLDYTRQAAGRPAAAVCREVQQLRQALGLEKSQLELHICGSVGADRWVDAAQFTRRLGIQPASSHAARLYQIFQQKSSGLVYFPDYLLCAAFLSLQHEPLSHLLAYAFKLYSSNGSGRLTQAQFVEAAGKCLAMCQEDAANTFQQADVEERGTLTYAQAAGKCLALCQEDAANTFQQADVEERGTLTYGTFTYC
ncbi:unnamed protein product [Plutella xylostella]|uniref:(diamondback moth) hypothetical protein n=1 Tax=Plutella xylostella TaxID=51655 RepID=A0A8S4D405_PLUXY|nr:unnamed protein product [Plutella xylostella]